jgi:hypothetical protein
MTHTATETVQIRAHHVAVLDLLLPELEPGDVEVALDIDHTAALQLDAVSRPAAYAGRSCGAA